MEQGSANIGHAGVKGTRYAAQGRRVLIPVHMSDAVLQQILSHRTRAIQWNAFEIRV
jgi:hypothetical protein